MQETLPPTARDAAPQRTCRRAAVIDDDNATVEQIGAQVTALAALRGKVDEAAATQIRARMSDLRKAIGPIPISPAPPEIGDIETKLAVPGIRARWTPSSSCASNYAKGSAASLAEVMKTRPYGVDAAEWPAIVAEVEKYLAAIPARRRNRHHRASPGHDRVPQAGGNCFRRRDRRKLQAKPGNVALTALQAGLTTLMADVEADKIDGAIRRMAELQRDYNIAVAGLPQALRLLRRGDSG